MEYRTLTLFGMSLSATEIAQIGLALSDSIMLQIEHAELSMVRNYWQEFAMLK